ncbi:hypothetical protein [Pedobacter sp. SYSU D00535]|uniref:hypothetical protein n=1 Tax=Pedobacter sp. SYSU D00535 TaxID=2810308 RepID=UPI001A961A94|nr:hypothetical protein [Pedobacter sp. SYSU D00535]
MAVYNGKSLSGLIGNIVLRQMRDKNVAQSRPSSFEQSESTRDNGTELSRASAFGKLVRIIFQPLLMGNYDGGMVNRLSVAIRMAIRENQAQQVWARGVEGAKMEKLEGFEFNLNSPLENVFNVFPVASISGQDELIIEVPSFKPEHDIRTKLDWTCGSLRILTAVLDLENYAFCYLPEQELSFRRTEEENAAFQSLVPLAGLKEHIVITCLAVELIKETRRGQSILNNKQFNPVSIIGASRLSGVALTDGETPPELEWEPATAYQHSVSKITGKLMARKMEEKKKASRKKRS